MVNYNKYFKEAPLSKEWKRSTFEINPNECSNTTSFALGEIVPLYAPIEVIPHDTFVFDLASLIRMPDPFIAPILDGLDFDVYAFYVPKRLVWNFTKEFYGQSDSAGAQREEYIEPKIPIDQLCLNPENDDYMSESAYQRTIASHLGIPYVNYGSYNIDDVDDYTFVNVLPLRGYFMIWNYYFRDQNLQNEFHVSTDGSDVLGFDDAAIINDQFDPNDQDVDIHYGASCNLLRACKKHDYFTSMLPYAEKTGTDILIPMAGKAPILAEDSLHDMNKPFKLGTSGIPAGTKYDDEMAALGFIPQDLKAGASIKVIKGETQLPEDIYYGGVETGGVDRSNLYADLEHVTAANINLLRESLALYRLYQVDAIGGTRYDEQIFSHFGCRPVAETFKPELLGEAHFKLNIDQVVSHAGNEVESLGETAGYSVTGNKSHLVTKSFTEAGYIFVLGVARQSYHVYPDGLDPLWSKSRRFDYFYPEFANLGLMPRNVREIKCTNKSSDNNIFGFNDYGNDNRHFRPMVTGAINPNRSGSLDFYSLADETPSNVSLSNAFILEDGENLARCIASGEKVNQFVARFALKGTMTRVLPVTSIPKGLI